MHILNHEIKQIRWHKYILCKTCQNFDKKIETVSNEIYKKGFTYKYI